jgi:hypothetical protein
MAVADTTAERWKALQKATRECAVCGRLEGILFVPFLDSFPELPNPGPRPILFLSEAPPRAGGFWKVGTEGAREDDLREKLLPLLQLRTAGRDGGLASFVSAGFFLLQSFPRPLKFSAAGMKREDLAEMLAHPVAAHLGPYIRHIAPGGVVSLGRVAASAITLLYPASQFAKAFRTRDFEGVRGRTFRDEGLPPVGATYLPSGAGRFFRADWERDIPAFLGTLKTPDDGPRT